jgi:rubrerythrin
MAGILDIAELVKKLALIEEEGVAFYESLARHTGNEKIGKLARMMARVEKRHQVRFEKISQTLAKRKTKKSSDKMDADLRGYILALIDHRIFNSPEHAETIAANLADENEAVDMAIRFEKENILLLLECREVVRGEERRIIEKFIGQEKAHVLSLQKVRQQLARMA